MAGLVLAILVGGFVLAHLSKVVLDDADAFWANPMAALQTTTGIRSVGGFFGGLGVGLLWCKIRGIRGEETLRMLDRITYVLPLSFMMGRLGCSLVHDHIGRDSGSWMAVAFPGGPAYDLGMIEFVLLIPLLMLFWYLGRKARPAGFYFGMFGVLYGGMRASIDTLQVHPYAWMFGASLVGQATGLLGWVAMWRYQKRRCGRLSRVERDRGRATRLAIEKVLKLS